MLNEYTDKTDALTLDCEKLSSLVWLFAEQYTTGRADATLEAIKANPEAFCVLFALIEDKVLEIKKQASELADMAYGKKSA